MNKKEENGKVSFRTDCFDLAQIADSGQCFRMTRQNDGSFLIVAADRWTTAREQDGWIQLGCTDSEFESFWRHYFDLDTDYASYGRNIDPSDEYLQAAFKAGSGIRILNQDPWEMLITFIISQRKNIPAIRQAVEALSKRCGVCLCAEMGIYAFPTPKELSALSLEDLGGLSLGYRAKYIYETTRQAVSGEIDFNAWKNLGDDELMQRLLACYGVGKKVANCVLLFGYHRTGAFPVDVWIDRIQREHYNGSFPVKKYAGYAGALQQYMFYSERTNRKV